MGLVESNCRGLFHENADDGSGHPARVRTLKHAMDHVFESVGFHVARASYAREVQRAQGDRRGEWCNVATLRAMLAAPDDFDDVYGILADDSSPSVFEWFVRARTAAAWVGRETPC